MSKKRIAVVYARYSSHRQGEQSIEGQLAEAYKYAAAHGLTIVKEYCDRAMTGRNDNREQFQEMLKDTAKKQFDTIILWKIDRFGRNREEIAFNKYRCKKNGVKVVYVAESIPDSPEGVILESVLEGMAEYYSLQLSQNILRGQRASAEKCQSTGGNRPLGYKTDPATKKFVIDPETAPTVRLVFDMYAKGSTVTEIVTELNNRGLRTLRGGKFTKNSLHSMLKNEKYIGVYTYKDDVRIEGIVLNAVVDLLKDEELLEFIADGVFAYYQEQNADNDLADALKRKLAEVDKATANIIKAIEAGIFNDATKKRMDELDAQRAEIEAELSHLELVRSWQLTRDHILFFLYEMRDKNIKDPECQKQLVQTFVNAVFVYDDKVTITFNYSGDKRTVTLAEVDSLGTEGAEFVCRALCSTKRTGVRKMRTPVLLTELYRRPSL